MSNALGVDIEKMTKYSLALRFGPKPT